MNGRHGRAHSIAGSLGDNWLCGQANSAGCSAVFTPACKRQCLPKPSTCSLGCCRSLASARMSLPGSNSQTTLLSALRMLCFAGGVQRAGGLLLLQSPGLPHCSGVRLPCECASCLPTPLWVCWPAGLLHHQDHIAVECGFNVRWLAERLCTEMARVQKGGRAWMPRAGGACSSGP